MYSMRQKRFRVMEGIKITLYSSIQLLNLSELLIDGVNIARNLLNSYWHIQLTFTPTCRLHVYTL